MLEFIHSTPDDLGKGTQTRRRVRAHAMRDYRQRQRDRRLILRDIQRSWTEEDLILSDDHEWNDENDGTVPLQSASAQSLGCGASVTRPTSIVISQNEITVPTRPSLYGPDTSDIFGSPIKVSHMLAICGKWIRWLRSDCWGDQAATLVTRAWANSPCAMGIAATTLISVGQLEPTQEQRLPVNETLLKGVVLREINKRMSSRSSGTSDVVINTMMLLASFELLRLSKDTITHLRGLRKVITLRGGIENLGPSSANLSLAMMLETLDLVQAISFGSPLIFTNCIRGAGNPLLRTESKSRGTNSQHLIKVVTAELRNLFRSPLILDRSSFAEDFGDLFKRVIRCIEAPSTALTEGAERVFEDLESFNDRYCKDDNGELFNNSCLGRACHQSVAILYNWTINKHGPGHLSNESYADGIFKTLREADNSTWKYVPYTHILVLLIGITASKDVTKRSFFVSHLTRTIYRTGSPRWIEVRAFIHDYKRLKQALASSRSSKTHVDKWNDESQGDDLHDGDHSFTDVPKSQVVNAEYGKCYGPYSPPNSSNAPRTLFIEGNTDSTESHGSKLVAVGWPLPSVEVVCAGEQQHIPQEQFKHDTHRQFYMINSQGDFWITAHKRALENDGLVVG